MDHPEKPHEIVFTIPAGKANRLSFLLFFMAFLVFGVPYIMLWGWLEFRAAFVSFMTNYALLILTLIIGVLLHEALHAVTFAAFWRQGFRSVSFGVNWKHLAPFVHCREDLTVPQYSIATFMPGLMLGLVPCCISLATGNGWLIIFGLFFTAGSASDFLSLLRLRGTNPEYRVQDHPDEAGFILKK